MKEMERRAEGRHREKSDEGPMTTLNEFGGWVQEKLFFLDYAPVIFTSAKSGFHLDRLLEVIRYVTAQSTQTIPTALLNRTIADAVEKRGPSSKQGHRMKFYYATQVGSTPPRFVLFLNRKEMLADDYVKYLSRELRRAFGFEGCPVLFYGRERPKKVESKRKPFKRTSKSKGLARGKGPAKGREKPGTTRRPGKIMSRRKKR